LTLPDLLKPVIRLVIAQLTVFIVTPGASSNSMPTVPVAPSAPTSDDVPVALEHARAVPTPMTSPKSTALRSSDFMLDILLLRSGDDPPRVLAATCGASMKDVVGLRPDVGPKVALVRLLIVRFQQDFDFGGDPPSSRSASTRLALKGRPRAATTAACAPPCSPLGAAFPGAIATDELVEALAFGNGQKSSRVARAPRAGWLMVR